MHLLHAAAAKFQSEWNHTTIAIVCATLFALVYSIYTFALFPNFNKTPGKFKGNFSHRSRDFIEKRRRKFPPPYPNGWFKLCDVADLANGNIVSVTALGMDLVVFQGRESGRIGVLDAFCPHLGAHLGEGGKVTGDCLQCPFHGWEFAADGACTKIPYSNAAVPKTARAQIFRHTIYMQMVFLWFHAEGEEPTFELMPLTWIDDRWSKVGCKTTSYDMHIIDMAENSADYYHFNFLHGPLMLPFLRHFITMTYETELHFPSEKENWCRCYFNNWSTVNVFHRFPWKWYKQLVVVTFDGPGVVHFDIKTPLGRVWLVKSLLPQEPFKVYSEDTWFAEKRTPRWLCHVLAVVAKGALEQDRQVWENRVFAQKPHLVKGDGPFLRYRQWFHQFYSENSAAVEERHLSREQNYLW